MGEATVEVHSVADFAGEVNLEVDAGGAAHGVASMDMSEMRPGDTSAGVLRVRNTGSVPLTYHLESTASNDDGLGLGAALVVKVTGADATVDTGRSSRCTGQTLAATGDRFGAHLVGSSASGRRLAAGASETLCIQAELPYSAPSSLQGAVTVVDLEVHGMP